VTDWNASPFPDDQKPGSRANGLDPHPPWDYPEDPWQPIFMSSLQGLAVPRRGWIVPDWLPALETTGFSGSGALGKTLISMQLATAAVLGVHWFNIPLRQMRVAALLCEDRPNDVHLRQANDINPAYHCDFADLGNLLVLPRRSHPRNRLAIFDRDGICHPTPFFAQLQREVVDFGAELVIIDTKSDVFLGNQNDEDQARTFVRQICDPIAEAIRGGVLLLSHPSRAGKREGTGESGSVQWDAAFRCRWYLEAALDDEAANPDRRILRRAKSNFAARDHTLELRWQAGVFVRTDDPAESGLDATARHNKADRVFLALVEKAAKQGRLISDANSSPRYAPKMFAGDRTGSEGLKLRDLEGAMNRLFSRNEIRVDETGPAWRPKRTIAKVEHGIG
jgi:RecA-family ATPase